MKQRFVRAALAVVLALGFSTPAAFGDDSMPSDEPTTVPTTEPTTVPTAEPTTEPTPSEPAYVVRRQVIGKSVKGRPIVAYFRGDPSAKHVVLVLGQMHGDERAGPRTARHIIENLRPSAGTGLWVISTMNPDGFAKGTRTNARGVDLNRNWPTSGWKRGVKGSRTYGGSRRASEPETRALIRFLELYRPDYIASIHQPLNGIGKSGKDVRFEKRLAANLGLKRKTFSVGKGNKVAPTMTSWYNHRLGRSGTAITIEYSRKPSKTFVTKKAGVGILRAARVRR
ncbi:MAG TPA: DUF2817 domain-containing protein [Aeromicrobium sp.]|nr:DUF2817 domain-containing protein [Aeromicrobium sp.]